MNFLRKHGGLGAVALILLGTLLAVTSHTEAKDVREWSTTAASNNDAAPDGFPEGMPPSGVNDSARELMAATKAWYDTTYGRNALINGGFMVAQRGTSFTSTTTPANSDDTYLIDRWILLSDGNDVVDVTQETTTVPTGAYAAIKLDVETADKKFGILQVVEARDAARFKSGTASLSFQARVTGTSISEIRAGVVCWSSTADSVTSDIVSSWGGAGTNPTLVSNWAFSNTPADLTNISTSYQTYRIENISVGSGCNNVGVFIWTDDVTLTIGDFLFISEVQLEPGAVATNFERLPYGQVLSQAHRYYWRVTRTATGEAFAIGQATATTTAQGFIRYPVPLRTAPTFVVSNVADFQISDADFAALATTNLTASLDGFTATRLAATVAAGLTKGHATIYTFDATSGGFFSFDAEM
jgi:hypothetical protein